MSSGLFASVEGVDGAGKGTQLALLAHRLRRTGREVVTTFTPGGTQFGMLLRRMLVDEMPDLANWTEFTLFLADMVETGERVVLPALQQGAIVLTDRWWDSTLVYQDYRRHGRFKTFTDLKIQHPGLLEPSVKLLLDLPIEEAAARTARRGEQNHYDLEGIERRQRIRDGFLHLAKEQYGYFIHQGQNPWRVVDAVGTVDEVHGRVWEAFVSLVSPFAVTFKERSA